MRVEAVIFAIVFVAVAAGPAALYATRKRRWSAAQHARHRLRKAERVHARRVDAATRAVASARKPSKIAAYQGCFVLYDSEIHTPSGRHTLDESVTASVETAGSIAHATSHSSRMSATRIGVGAIVAGPLGAIVGAASPKSVKHEKTIDKRELYLLVQGDGWSDIKRCNPDHGEAVRRFALAVGTAARGAARAREDRMRRVAEMERALRIVRADTDEITAARHDLEQAADGA